MAFILTSLDALGFDDFEDIAEVMVSEYVEVQDKRGVSVETKDITWKKCVDESNDDNEYEDDEDDEEDHSSEDGYYNVGKKFHCSFVQFQLKHAGLHL